MASSYKRKLNEILDQVFEEGTIRGWTWPQLAAASGLHVSTVYKIGRRETQLPRFQTIFLLCDCVGMQLYATQLKLRKAM